MSNIQPTMSAESSSSTSSARKNPPQRLEEALKNVPRFKPAMTQPHRRTVADILGDRACELAYDEILGPLVNKSTSNRRPSGGPPSSSSSAADSMYEGEFSFDRMSTSRDNTTIPEADGDFTTRLLIRLSDAEQETKR